MNIFEVEDVTLKRIFIHSGVIVNGYLGGDTCVPGEQPVILQVDVLVKKRILLLPLQVRPFHFFAEVTLPFQFKKQRPQSNRKSQKHRRCNKHPRLQKKKKIIPRILSRNNLVK